MKTTSVLAAAALVASSAAWLIPQQHSNGVSAAAQLPRCGKDGPHPCSCPAGTSYTFINTYFSWGASAKEVYELTGNFSDLSWVPQSIKSTTGPDNTLGSTRTTTVALDVGTFDWTEELTEVWHDESTGNFAWAFELKNVPLDFKAVMPGRFEGEWERFEARNVGEHQTDVYWSLFGCHTGGTHSFPVFQRYVIGHVHALMEASGAIKGTTTLPFSDIRIGHKDGALVDPGFAAEMQQKQESRFSQSSSGETQYVLARKGSVGGVWNGI